MSCFASHDRLAVTLPHTPPDLASVNSNTSPFLQRQSQTSSSSSAGSGSSSRPLSRPSPPPPSTSLFATAYRPGVRPPPLLPTSSLPAPKRDAPQEPPSSITAASPPSSSSTSSAVLFRDVAWSKCYQQHHPSHTNHHPSALQPPISPPMSSHDHPPSPLPSAEPPQVARAHTYSQQQQVRSSSTNHSGPLSVSSSSSSSADTVALAAAAAAAAARVEMVSSAGGTSSSGGSASHNDNDRHQHQHQHQNHPQYRQPQKQHQQLPSLSSLFGPPSSERLRTPLLLLPSPLPPTYAPQSREPQAYQQQQQPQPQPQPQTYNHRHPRHDATGPSELSARSNRLEHRLDTGLQHVAPSTERWFQTAQRQAGSSSYAPLPAAATTSTPTHAASGRRRGSSSSSINGRPPLTPPLPPSTTTAETAPNGSGSSSGSGLPRADGLGPKIWTGTQFLPRFVRTAEVPGEGLCYFYDDGSYCKTIIDGEAVNAHWGVTKAGKPRKRLAIACVLCREKKVKCDPDFPRCVQCQKFGRPCRFKNAPRGHNAVSPGATTPVWPAEDDSSVRTVQQQQQQHESNHDHDRDQTSKRMRTGYDHYKETGGGGGGSSASSRSSPVAMSTATVDSARPGSARSVPPLPPVSWAGQPPQAQAPPPQHPSPQPSYTHAMTAAAAAVDASYPPSSASSSASAAASSAPPSSYGAASYRPPYPLSPVPSQPTTMDQQPRHLPSDLPRFHLPPPRSQPATDRPRLQDDVLRRPW